LIMKYTITIRNKTYPIEVTRKKMKYARLKVFYTGEIKLSVPNDTSDSWIREFIETKHDWIAEQLSNLPDVEHTESRIDNGSKLRVLGNDLTVVIHPAKRKQIVFDDSFLHIYTPETDAAHIERQIDNWWKKASKECYQELLNKLYLIVKPYGVAKPTITVKKMKTLWGSCSRRTWNVNINYYLFKASKPCIESVILHELTHFIHPNHDKAFYDFMTLYMPDWKTREKELDYKLIEHR